MQLDAREFAEKVWQRNGHNVLIGLIRVGLANHRVVRYHAVFVFSLGSQGLVRGAHPTVRRRWLGLLAWVRLAFSFWRLVRLSSGCGPTSIVRGRGGRPVRACRCTTG